MAPDTAADAFFRQESPLFAFGTLRDVDTLEMVLGRATGHLRREPATLSGFRCHRAEGEVFPILVADPRLEPSDDGEGRETVRGDLLHGLDVEDLRRILFYEGAGYELRPLAVMGRDERRRTTARVFLSTGLLRDSGEVWDFDAWLERDKPLALALAGDVMARYGAGPLGSVDGAPREGQKTRRLTVPTDGGADEERLARQG